MVTTSASDLIDADNSKPIELLVVLSSFLLWAGVIWWSYTQMMRMERYAVLFLASMFLVYTINELSSSWAENDWADVLTMVVSGTVLVSFSMYIFFFFHEIYIERIATPYEYEIIFASMFTVALVYIAFREFGYPFLLIMVLGIAYGLWGQYAPGILSHGGMGWVRMMNILSLEVAGFFGFLTRLTARWIALFLLLAGLLQAYGAFDYLTRMSFKSVKYIRSGVAQSAVVSSVIIGSINGSTAANTAMTGSFTIPLMKKYGLKNKTAGGIEAVASTVGQGLPPVMGAGAFIMAALVGVSYWTVVMAGILPALILVGTICIAVHLTAVNQLDDSVQVANLSQEIEDNPYSRAQWIINAIAFVTPIGVLVYLLGYLQYTVMTSALYTCISMIVLGILKNYLLYFEGSGQLENPTKANVFQTIHGFKIGAIGLAPIALILAAINGFVDVLLTTGVPGLFSLALVGLSGGILILALMLALLASIVLGLGMPTSAAYLLTAILIAPTFVNDFGVPAFGAHFFVFYAAILAAITPPIATSVAVATGIAQSDFWETSKEALRIGLPLFILPFSFVYHPEIVSGSLSIDGVSSASIIFFGSVLVTVGLNFGSQNYHLGRVPRYALRASYIVVGSNVMINPHPTFMFGGIAVGLVMAAGQVLYLRNTPSPTVQKITRHLTSITNR